MSFRQGLVRPAIVPAEQRWTEGFYRLRVMRTPSDDANAGVLVAAIFFGDFTLPAGSARGYCMGLPTGGRGRPSGWLLLTSKDVLEARWEGKYSSLGVRGEIVSWMCTSLVRAGSATP